ncbi:HGR053Wp [Eremothecium sinecaudum]|uniref:HGR053Wp n=1 Tax=Eremothecium sinecaudum TaxID=45286 RepID=A0A0X8HVT6_9SACH|nr:HGR053Wp [Eremothecium sinecaudum]AMD22392.1 HGR053Wp [Eremothecium sinecaudum]
MPLDSKWATASIELETVKIPDRKDRSSPKKTVVENGTNTSKWAHVEKQDNRKHKQTKLKRFRGKSQSLTEYSSNPSSENELTNSRPSTGDSNYSSKNQIFDTHTVEGHSLKEDSHERFTHQPNELAFRLGLVQPKSLEKGSVSRTHKREQLSQSEKALRGGDSRKEKVKELALNSNPLAVRLGIGLPNPVTERGVKSNSVSNKRTKDKNNGTKDPQLRKHLLERNIEEKKNVLLKNIHKEKQKQILTDFLNDDFSLEWDESELVAQLQELQTS